ncbi:hypothetical protein [Sagittula sp. SSi028]|uniref:hypothetical protein n=1 Tax=Sagittula sp. SSi028 TaxID=3400636 RepID=UPI003AF9126F
MQKLVETLIIQPIAQLFDLLAGPAHQDRRPQRGELLPIRAEAVARRDVLKRR